MPAMSNEKEISRHNMKKLSDSSSKVVPARCEHRSHNISLEQNMSTRHRMVDLQVQPEDHRLEH